MISPTLFPILGRCCRFTWLHLWSVWTTGESLSSSASGAPSLSRWVPRVLCLCQGAICPQTEEVSIIHIGISIRTQNKGLRGGASHYQFWWAWLRREGTQWGSTPFSVKCLSNFRFICPQDTLTDMSFSPIFTKIKGLKETYIHGVSWSLYIAYGPLVMWDFPFLYL